MMSAEIRYPIPIFSVMLLFFVMVNDTSFAIGSIDRIDPITVVIGRIRSYPNMNIKPKTAQV